MAKKKKKNHLFVFFVFIVYIMMLLSKGTETCMNFRYESCNILKSLGCLPALRPTSSHHTSLQPTCLFFILAAGDKDWLAGTFTKRERESRVREEEEEGEQTCEEEEEGDEEKDTGSSRRSRAEVIPEREADV